jgi:U3 small nucleolar RNA-associated protein 3
LKGIFFWSFSDDSRVVLEELPAPDLSKLSKSACLKILQSRHPDVPRLAKLYGRLHLQLSSLSLLAQRPAHRQHNLIKLKLALLSVLLSSIAAFFALRADQKERKSTEKKFIAKISETERLWKQISSIFIDESAVDVKELANPEIKANLALRNLPVKPTNTTLKRKLASKSLAGRSDDSDTEIPPSLFKKSRTKAKRANSDDNLSDFGDPTALHPLDAQEKSQNKKSLRFYAAQIENKGAKRREKYSGDTEVFRERRNDRNERQIEAARKRGLPVTTNEMIEISPSDEPTVPVKKDDYYDVIAARTAHKKAHGKEEYESSKAAARAFLLGQTEEVDESGKRLITRQIEKNKGLMPHRSKDVRNPRVKKRKKYEKKKIALKGRQQVYEIGDRRRGAYGGEESGISKNVVRGLKLG